MHAAALIDRKAYAGEHSAIVKTECLDKVQARLRDNKTYSHQQEVLTYLGVLDNDPYCTDEMKAGLEVRFQPPHVIQIYEDDDSQ